jgi:hypothetical protein
LRSTRSLAAKLLATVLSLTAGSADIISFLGFGGLFAVGHCVDRLGITRDGKDLPSASAGAICSRLARGNRV